MIIFPFDTISQIKQQAKDFEMPILCLEYNCENVYTPNKTQEYINSASVLFVGLCPAIFICIIIELLFFRRRSRNRDVSASQNSTPTFKN